MPRWGITPMIRATSPRPTRSAPLRAPSSTEVGGNGVYRNGAGGASPPAPTAWRMLLGRCALQDPLSLSAERRRGARGALVRTCGRLEPIPKKSRRQVGPLHDRRVQVAARPSPTPRSRGSPCKPRRRHPLSTRDVHAKTNDARADNQAHDQWEDSTNPRGRGRRHSNRRFCGARAVTAFAPVHVS
jgi:hypothetical protein